ncbi:MAG: PQQ-binding-like beta-propeller repeat protein, partial [Planctomycetota bacterium]
HTGAARDSRDARLRLAIEAGDSAASVRAAFEELPADWSAETTTPRQARLVWLAAQALRSDGNPRYASSLLSRLGKFQPEVSADEQTPEVTFAALASVAETAATVAVDPARSAHFDTPESEILNEGAESVLLGELDLGAKSVFIIAGRNRFSAFGADGTRLWTQGVEGTISPGTWQNHALLIPAGPTSAAGIFAGARVVLTSRGGIQALDGATGEELWTWEVRGNLLDSPLACDGGVLTVSAMQPGISALLFGIDIGHGTQLWEHVCPPGLWAQPVVGSGLALLLPKQPQFHKADVIELATGTLIRSVEVGQLVPTEDRRAAWIENGRLILPHFTAAHATQDALVAFDLDTGQRAWRVPSDHLRDLDSIARCADDTYLLYRVNGKGSGAGNLKELDTRIGAVREVPGVSIGPSDLPIGLRQNGVTRLGAPYLFLRSSVSGGSETLVRSVHLPYGQRWACRLPIKQDDLYSGLLPLPAVSSHLVVFAYTQELAPGAGRAQAKTRLMLVERDSGTPRTNRDLPGEMGRSEALEMATLGNLLILCGKDRTMIWAGPDTKEQR